MRLICIVSPSSTIGDPFFFSAVWHSTTFLSNISSFASRLAGLTAAVDKLSVFLADELELQDATPSGARQRRSG